LFNYQLLPERILNLAFTQQEFRDIESIVTYSILGKSHSFELVSTPCLEVFLNLHVATWKWFQACKQLVSDKNGKILSAIESSKKQATPQAFREFAAIPSRFHICYSDGSQLTLI